jgi:DNA-binding transcriptional LysR family regulator
VRSDQVERRLKLRELRILLAVARAGTMAKAAAELAISQPNVSKAIADLEQAFGARLLDRNARGVEPTTYGRAVIKRGVAVFDELRHAVDDVAFLADPTSGELRLGCSDWASSIVGAAIDQILRRCPRIAFDVLTTDTIALQRELKGRTIELFVAARLDSLSSEDFDADILYDDPFVVVADARHPLAGRRNIKLAELIKEAWALPTANTIAGTYIRDAFRKNGLPLPTTIVSTYSAVLQHYLLATSRFIMVLPKSMLHLMARSYALKELPVALPPMQRRLAIVVLKGRTLSPIAQLFMETVRSVAKSGTNARKPGSTRRASSRA